MIAVSVGPATFGDDKKLAVLVCLPGVGRAAFADPADVDFLIQQLQLASSELKKRIRANTQDPLPV